VATRADAPPALRGGQDRLAPVFVVTSRETYQAFFRPFARTRGNRFDSSGQALVLAELRAHQLEDVSRQIHAREHRCGGYFAFATRAQAEAFIRADRSHQALQAASAPAYAIDNAATVLSWLAEPLEANIHATINHLSRGYPNRYYASNHGREAATWIRNTWLGLAGGRSDVSAELYTGCVNCSTQPSVILTIQGTDLADEIVVLGGHLDSISSTGFGDFMNAPGADDDASGIATLTEILRVAMDSGWRPRRTVKFMAYAAEEVGLRGSQAIASSFANQGLDVFGVLQLDMTNYKSGTGIDMRLVTDYSNPVLQDFMVELFDQYLAPRGLVRGTETCGYGCSDHASWTSAGYPSGMMFEAGDPNGYFPYIHTPYDTLDNMQESAAHSVKFAQFGLAFLGELAKTAGIQVPRLPECDGRQQQGAALKLP
jgi:leucyl aminopeptidase